MSRTESTEWLRFVTVVKSSAFSAPKGIGASFEDLVKDAHRAGRSETDEWLLTPVFLMSISVAMIAMVSSMWLDRFV
jgi:hypothetical protein